ncbi:zinc-binding dehydrogenase [Neiella sp. HB171785]|uniref:Zinc-binding dehydrogenase n=1 Tax=Neiella litorisoli TaxID=2771431 RepID=A0A8J6QFP4_9GAMM|nr:zinc-binding dehydrogenase [Neiella litorisoli]MBD1388914.1 zinc-binding dehydrogenase [Neiella litorisoli]
MQAVSYSPEHDRFQLGEQAQPQLETEFDVLVAVQAVGLNPVDSKINLWQGMVAGMTDDFVGGLDVAGTIVDVGAAVSCWQVGDKVLYHGNMRRHHGGFAQFAIHDSRTLTPLPNVAPEVAAATPCAAWTAWRALEKLSARGADSILITGGSGGVGSFAIQLAKHFGIGQIITSCSAANHPYVQSLGADIAIDYHQHNVVDAIMQATNQQGVAIALDCVGGDNEVQCANSLRFDGQLVELVQTCEPSKYQDAFLRGISCHQLSLGSGHVHGDFGRNSIVTAGLAVNQLLANQTIAVPKLTTLSLAEVPAALMAMREQRTVGKLVALID